MNMFSLFVFSRVLLFRARSLPAARQSTGGGGRSTLARVPAVLHVLLRVRQVSTALEFYCILGLCSGLVGAASYVWEYALSCWNHGFALGLHFTLRSLWWD